MAKRRWIILVLSLLLLAGCSPQYSPSRTLGGSPAATSVVSENFPPQSPSDKNATGSNSSASPQVTTPADGQRLVVMNASLSIVVPEPSATLDFITDLAGNMKGFVVSSNLYKATSDSGEEIPAANITIRVPSERLNDALTQIKTQVKNPATDIRSETVSGLDVTKEYTDLQSQLTNLQQAEKQLQNIMDSATKTEDVLNVFSQLTQIRSQIEVLQGQIKYYEESAALSAISVAIASTASVKPLTIGGWEPVGIARNAVQTLIDALQVLADVGIWGVLFCLPIFIVIGVPLYLIYLFIRRQRTRLQRQQTPTPPPTAD